MTKKLEEEILKAVLFIPGIMALAPTNFTKKPSLLSERDFQKGISYEETPSGLLVRISIIIEGSVRAKLVARQITISVKDIFRQSVQKLFKVVVYIRGVK